MATVQAPHRQAADERMPALAGFTALLAGAALLTPLWAPEPDRASGFLLFGGVVAELVYSFRCKTSEAQRSAWASAGFTLLLALVLLKWTTSSSPGFAPCSTPREASW
jgi:hypothetical protein